MFSIQFYSSCTVCDKAVLKLFKLVFKFAGKPPPLGGRPLVSTRGYYQYVYTATGAPALPPHFPFQAQNLHQAQPVLPTTDQLPPQSSAAGQRDIPELLQHRDMHQEPVSSCIPWPARNYFVLGASESQDFNCQGSPADLCTHRLLTPAAHCTPLAVRLCNLLLWVL